MFTRSLPDPTLHLAPGAVTWLHLRRGSTLQLSAGRVRLHEPPQWLVERVLQLPVTLEAGAPHRLARGGWIRLEALDGVPACLQACAGRWRTTGVLTSRPITERAYR